MWQTSARQSLSICTEFQNKVVCFEKRGGGCVHSPAVRSEVHSVSVGKETPPVKGEKKHSNEIRLGGWINFPKALWSTSGTTLSLWGTPAAQKGPFCHPRAEEHFLHCPHSWKW